jgi:hypothetical protein
VQASGAVAGLDATEQGRPIYLPLGFQRSLQISRWHFDWRDGHAAGVAVRRSTADLPELRPTTGASGMERPRCCGTWRSASRRAPGWRGRTGASRASCMGREGRTAHSLGPVVADDEATAWR